MSQVTADRLRAAVEKSAPLLLALPEAGQRLRPAPGKWSPIELVGHLIDSAANNHQRFVRAQQQDNLVFLGYAQDEWVKQQNYQEADWQETVSFWQAYNLHLARVIEHIPLEVCIKEHLEHNLDRIAFRTVPRGIKVTLAYFMNDYVDHLVHHLKQLLADFSEDA
ncbi:MAG: DinB family protein [Bacteroidota bacterium]